MASPIGHGLMGYAICAAVGQATTPRFRTRVGLCVGLSILPDMDFVPGLLLGDAGMFHQGASHSLFAALLVGLAAGSWYARSGEGVPRAWLLFSVAYASHLVLDFFGPDTSTPIGMPLLWPFSTAHFLGPVQVLLGVVRSSPDTAGIVQWVSGILISHNVAAIGREVMVVGPIAVVATGIARWQRKLTRTEA